jgi:hypothetical protein
MDEDLSPVSGSILVDNCFYCLNTRKKRVVYYSTVPYYWIACPYCVKTLNTAEDKIRRSRKIKKS